MIKDSEFIRGNVPMTKEEIRIISISKLELKKDSICLDIGAGTGSISVEMSKQSYDGQVYSIEKKEKACEIFLKNIEKFNIKNNILIKDNAPKGIPNIVFDAIFIGGSSGNIEDIINKSFYILKENGKIVLNFITIENTYKSINALKQNGFREIDIISVTIARGKSVGGVTLMEGMNPIYIISARK